MSFYKHKWINIFNNGIHVIQSRFLMWFLTRFPWTVPGRNGSSEYMTWSKLNNLIKKIFLSKLQKFNHHGVAPFLVHVSQFANMPFFSLSKLLTPPPPSTHLITAWTGIQRDYDRQLSWRGWKDSLPIWINQTSLVETNFLKKKLDDDWICSDANISVIIVPCYW